GQQLALACSDGLIHLVAIEGMEKAPILVGTTRISRRVAGPIQRLFGRSQLVHVYPCTCVACRHAFDVDDAKAGRDLSCPKCHRALRLSGVTRIASEKESK